jgi:hypothetical protein
MILIDLRKNNNSGFTIFAPSFDRHTLQLRKMEKIRIFKFYLHKQVGALPFQSPRDEQVREDCEGIVML